MDLLAIALFPVYLVVLVLLWSAFFRGAQIATPKPSPLVTCVGGIAGLVLGFVFLKDVNLPGDALGPPTTGILGALLLAPLTAVIAGLMALALSRNRA